MEFASVGNKKIYHEMSEFIFPHITSLGMNEQEMNDVYNNFGLGNTKEIAQKNPNIKYVFETINFLMNKFSSITRIHFHSLAYHLLAIKDSKWKNPLESVALGSLAASSRANGGKELKVDEFDFLTNYQDFGFKSPLDSMTKDGVSYYFCQVLVCKIPVRTVGLGDTISAYGLMGHFIQE